MKKILLMILTLILHAFSKDAWISLVENEKQIIRNLLVANYFDTQSDHVDTSGLVENSYWGDDSIAHIECMDLRVGNLDKPKILPAVFDTLIDELGELKYLKIFRLDHKHRIKFLWNTIDKNDNLELIEMVPNLITLPKTISGCDKLTKIRLGGHIEYLPDEFLDLHLFPFMDWNNIHSIRGDIDLCECSEEKLIFTEKQKNWADVKDLKEYKKRFCDSLSDSAKVAELFRRNGYKDVDMSKAVRYYPNSNRIDSVIIRSEDFPEVKRINFWVDFESMDMLKYIEISGIDTLNFDKNNLFRTYWTSEGEDTVVIDSLREINFNNIKSYEVYKATWGMYEQTMNREKFEVFRLRNCNIMLDDLPQSLHYHKVSPTRIDICENDSIIFNDKFKSWFKEYGYDIETYDDYEDAFCQTDAIEPTTKVSSKSFSVSHSKSALKITLPQSGFIKKMKLLTVDGRVVKEFSVPKRTTFPTQFSLPLSDSLSSGIYIFSLVTDTEQFQQRFVVE